MVLHCLWICGFVWLCTKTRRKDNKWICLILEEIYFCTVKRICLVLHGTTLGICLVMHEISYFAMEKRYRYRTYMLLHQSTMYTDANHSGLRAGTDISQIAKSGFVRFCRKASQNVASHCKLYSM